MSTQYISQLKWGENILFHKLKLNEWMQVMEYFVYSGIFSPRKYFRHYYYIEFLFVFRVGHFRQGLHSVCIFVFVLIMSSTRNPRNIDVKLIEVLCEIICYNIASVIKYVLSICFCLCAIYCDSVTEKKLHQT